MLRWLSSVPLVLLCALGCNGQLSGSDSTFQGDPGSPQGQGNAGSGTPGVAPDAPPFLVLESPPSALTNDEQNLSWSELGAVYRASKSAPVRERLFGDGTAAVQALLVDDVAVYASSAQLGGVRAWQKSDGTVETLLPDGSGATSLAQDEQNLYVGLADPGSGVHVLSKSTRAELRVLRAGQAVFAVAISGAVLFTFEGEAGSFRVVRSTTTDDTSAVVASASSLPNQLVANAGEAYWVDANLGLQSSKGGTLYDPRTTASPNAVLTGGVAVAEGFAHVVTSGLYGEFGEHSRVPIAGGEPDVVYGFQWSPSGGPIQRAGQVVTVDTNLLYVSAYWSDDNGTNRGDAILTTSLAPGL